MTETSPPTRLPGLDPRTAAELLRRDAAVLVDVREPQKWSAGQAPQAAHLPLGELTPEAATPGSPVVTDDGEPGTDA